MTPCPVCKSPLQGHPEALAYAPPFAPVACWFPEHGYRPVPAMPAPYEGQGRAWGHEQ